MATQRMTDIPWLRSRPMVAEEAPAILLWHGSRGVPPPRSVGEIMRRSGIWIATLAALSISTSTASAQTKSGVDKLYILNCGEGVAGDISRWSGVDVGKSMEMSENCYLIHHTQGWLLWDTGIADSIAAMPNGLAPSDPRAIHWHVTKTLASQLEMLSVKPADIKYVAISHSHPDHIGNITMFPQSIVLVQKAEYDWPAPFGQKLRAIASPVNKLEGDHDVFGDGSVTILATPGHTPGHQSLLRSDRLAGELDTKHIFQASHSQKIQD